MSNIALRVEGLSKQYRIGKQEQYRTLRDTITDAAAAPFRRAAGLLRGNSSAAANLTETIWALKDVSFEVKHGDVIGIIGRNGAGKSTLLKILSRITEPTSGYADVFGRVGALLEVGTGFHPELTGRENIFLNGAILGMSRDDITRRFDEIVDFAGVGTFIDTPVKHYSSGMGLRLGFAVAAHLEPEILIVDEVLAVGDAEFQKKCIGKMSEVAGEGRTVLFVSHNMTAVEALCTKGIILDKGSNRFQSDINSVIRAYVTDLSRSSQLISLQEREDRSGNGHFRFSRFHFEDHHGNVITQPRAGQSVVMVLGYKASHPVPLDRVSIAVRVTHILGQNICTFYNEFSGDLFSGQAVSGEFRCAIGSLPLASETYKLSIWASADGNAIDWIIDAITFDVVGSDFYKTGRMPAAQVHGPVLVHHHWQHTESVTHDA